VDLARLAGLEHEADARAGPLAQEVVLNRGDGQQRRDRRPVVIVPAVREDDDVVPVGDGLARRRAQDVDARLEPVRPFRGVEQHRQRDALEAARPVLAVEVAELLQLLVAQDRRGQLDLPRRGRRRLEQVPLRADRGVDGHDDLFADGVDGRVRHLREQLLEVVVEQLWPVRQHRQRRIGPHRPGRLDAVGGHRRDEHLEVLRRVAERLLAAQHRGVVGLDHHRRLRQLADLDHVLFQPDAVRRGGGHLLFDLVVADDPPLGGVDEEHAPRLQPPLVQDPLGRDVEHADLGGHHHEVVLGDVVARRPQPVAIERGADPDAVGEGHRRRPVPRLHEASVKSVEVLLRPRHRLVVGPRLGDHHHHRVRQAPPGEHEQLEHVVEHAGVAAVGVDDRDALLQVVAELLRLEHALARVHPVDVAAQGVDLAVVRDHPVGVRARPAREGVGREPRVHHRQRRLDPVVLEVRVERRQLIGVEHPLVDDGPRRQARDVEVRLLRDVEPPHLVPRAAPDDVELALEGVRVGQRRVVRVAPNEELLDHRLRPDRGRPDHAVVGRHLAPAEERLPLGGHDLLEQVLAGGPAPRIVGQERHPDAVGPRAGQLDAGLAARLRQEAMRDLHQDAGAVPGVLLAAAGAAMAEVEQHLDGVADDAAGLPSLEIHHETDATGIMLVLRVVKTLRRGRRHCRTFFHSSNFQKLAVEGPL